MEEVVNLEIDQIYRDLDNNIIKLLGVYDNYLIFEMLLNVDNHACTSVKEQILKYCYHLVQIYGLNH